MPLTRVDIEKFNKVLIVFNRNSGKQLFASMFSRVNEVYKRLKDILGAKRTEIYDIKRFSNERQFASYLGLIPTCHSSGEKVSHGEKTYRGNKVIGPLITEASWVAIQKDQGLNAAYGYYCQRMKPHNAIIRIARKLSNIIFHVLKNNIRYEPYQWDKDWQKTCL